MFSLNQHIVALQDRTSSAIRIIDETHSTAKRDDENGVSEAGPISKEAKGFVLVLLFGAYENLMYSLTRTLLEEAIRLRVGNRRLRPGLRAFALASSAQSIRNMSEKRLYSHALPKLVEAADPGGRTCTIDPNSFPIDGSFMKSSQIIVWCKLFDIPNPHLILHRTWAQIDAVVAERNGIAHGRLTADEVGRRYSEAEIRQLIDDWRDDWIDFLLFVESRAQSRDFFRMP